MTSTQRIRAEYELNKYLQLFSPSDTDVLPETKTLRDALDNHIELTILRLGVRGAFVLLTDGHFQNFLAGGHQSDSDSQVLFDNGNATWLHATNADRPAWLWLFQQTLAINTSAAPPDQSIFQVPSLRHMECTSKLSSVCGAPHLSFYAGAPITSSKTGLNIGAVFVVDNDSNRSRISASEASSLLKTAKKCMDLLEFARERGFHKRWASIREELDLFVKSHSLRDQMLEEPTTLMGKAASEKGTKEREGLMDDPSEAIEQPLAGVENPNAEGEESERLILAEVERDRRIVHADRVHEPRTLTAETTKDDKRGETKGETTYRKVFRRAAQCLHQALEVDGVLFVDGLIGFHGGLQPVPETEQELEREMAQSDQKYASGVQNTDPSGEGLHQSQHSADVSPPHTRTFFSTEYQRGVYIERAAEILGMSGDSEQVKTTRISDSTEGIATVDEGFLQRLMDRYPNGAVWYIDDTTVMQVKNETLVEDDALEMERLRNAFPGARQLIFQPLTEPTSLKRLAGCFVWKNNTLCPLTDRVDLASLHVFLHLVESEISRFDAAAAVKQRESLVSSVSHELRTPLHGILGATQLLNDTGLDSMQNALIDTITSCGSTLHETLTSFLSYAKINQFERRQHKYRQRRPPDSLWALPDKYGSSSGPDRDYEGLYICTNVAKLCEESVGVLEAGASADKSSESGNVVIIYNVDYEENWSFYTEPGALRRVMINLIGNALKYTSKGSIVVSLAAPRVIKDEHTVSNDLDAGRTITLTVVDTGKGMSKTFMENQLFVPFAQEDSTSSQGVGLGMSIVKSLVSLLSGKIEVKSEVGTGTEIRVRIPMTLCRSEDKKGQPTVELERDVEFLRAQRLSVVIFGFPDFVRASLERYLCDWFGCTILEATIDAKPDIVLVDEGNDEVSGAVNETTQAYGQFAVLLSIVMNSSRLAKPMNTISGYRKWERVPRPLGPNSIAKGLIACCAKLDGSTDNAKEEGVGEGTGNEKSPAEDKRALSKERAMPAKTRLQLVDDFSRLGIAPRILSTAAEESHQTGTTEQARQPASKPSPKTPKTTSSNVSSKLCFLVVDDNALNLRLLGAFLKKSGHRDIKEAVNGAIAVEAVVERLECFDIIFMDLSMPVMDGFAATRRIRDIEKERGYRDPAQTAVIVALTGLASEKDEKEAFGAGVDVFMTKPVQFGELSKLVRRCEDGTFQRKTSLAEADEK